MPLALPPSLDGRGATVILSYRLFRNHFPYRRIRAIHKMAMESLPRH